MSKPLKALVDDLRTGSNLEIYIASLIGAVVAGLGLFGVIEPEVLSATVLLVLSVVSWSLLTTRRHMDMVASSADEIAHQLAAINPRLAPEISLRLEYPDFTPLLAKSSSIAILGSSLSSITHYWTAFEEALSRGATLRLLVNEPTHENAQVLVYRSYTTHEGQIHSQADLDQLTSAEVATTLDTLARRLNRLQLLGRGEDEHTNLTIGTIAGPAPFGVALFGIPGEPSEVFVKLLPFRVPTGRYPVIALRSDRSPKWVDYFQQQFDALWSSSKTVYPAS